MRPFKLKLRNRHFLYALQAKVVRAFESVDDILVVGILPSSYERQWWSIQFISSAPARVAKQANSRVTVSAAFAAGER